MNIKSFKDMSGDKYTLLACGDSLNLSVNGQIISISQEQFREISEMANREWGGNKSKRHKCGNEHKGLHLSYFNGLLSNAGGSHDS